MVKSNGNRRAAQTVAEARSRGIPGHTRDRKNEPRRSLGQWLIENMPGFEEIEVPPRHEEHERPAPFADWTEGDWEAFERKHETR